MPHEHNCSPISGAQLSSSDLHTRQSGFTGRITGPVIVAAGVHHPDNAGAIFRIADALNCRKVLLVDVPHAGSRRMRKVSRRMSDRVAHQFVTFEQFSSLAPDLGVLVAVEIPDRATDLYATPLPADAAFIIGEERHGIPERVLALCQMAVYIPMFGINSSMNVAASLGIVLYEWYRQTYHDAG